MRDVLKLDEVFDAKPAIMRAFQIAKNCTKSKRTDVKGDDYIEFREFRFFLLSLRQYFEYYVAFVRSVWLFLKSFHINLSFEGYFRAGP